MKPAFLVLSLLIIIYSPSAVAGCSLSDECEDVIDSLVIVKGGGIESTITWETDSENVDLDSYQIIRADDPGSLSWTLIETVEPTGTCGNTAEYEINEDPPSGVWYYAVRVIKDGSAAVCTIFGD